MCVSLAELTKPPREKFRTPHVSEEAANVFGCPGTSQTTTAQRHFGSMSELFIIGSHWSRQASKCFSRVGFRWVPRVRWSLEVSSPVTKALMRVLSPTYFLGSERCGILRTMVVVVGAAIGAVLKAHRGHAHRMRLSQLARWSLSQHVTSEWNPQLPQLRYHRCGGSAFAHWM